MELGHVEALKVEFPTQADKVFAFSEMVGKRYSIRDPYGGPLSDYERMVAELTNLIDDGLDRIIALASKAK
jgi:protein-tyrosine-phosphatase